jgi:hypothetical protein
VEAVVRQGAGELGAHGALGLDVGVADEIAGSLLRDLQMLDLAEIALRLLAAAKAARIITVIVAERGASERRSGGPERSRPGAIGARPTRATG